MLLSWSSVNGVLLASHWTNQSIHGWQLRLAGLIRQPKSIEAPPRNTAGEVRTKSSLGSAKVITTVLDRFRVRLALLERRLSTARRDQFVTPLTVLLVQGFAYRTWRVTPYLRTVQLISYAKTRYFHFSTRSILVGDRRPESVVLIPKAAYFGPTLDASGR